MSRRPIDQYRWLAIENTESETMPSFGIGRIVGKRLIEGVTVFKIRKPIDLDESEQDASKYLFNGPTPIPKDGLGKGTTSWPVRALRSKQEPSIEARLCGPKAGSWYVSSSGTAFRCLLSDISLGVDSKIYQSVWVTPIVGIAEPINCEVGGGGADIAPDAAVSISSIDGFGDDNFTLSGNKIYVTHKGSYLVSLYCRLGSMTAPHGHILRLLVRLNAGYPGKPNVSRQQFVATDEYDVANRFSNENVAGTDRQEFYAGDYFEIVNGTATYSVDVSELRVHLFRIGGFIVNNQS